MIDCALEPLDRGALALRDGFDAAVREIPDPAMQAFALRGGFSEVPEADTLDTAADQISSRDPQLLRGGMIACGVWPESSARA